MASSSALKGQTIVSAPGKVLLAGGYLVLDQAYTGLILATSSRFYCIVDNLPATRTPSPSISIRAGQFPRDSSIWTYTLGIAKGRVELEQVDNEGIGRNKFVEITLNKALDFVLESLIRDTGEETAGEELLRRVKGHGGGLRIIVLADNDFYSQRETLAEKGLPLRSSSLTSISPFSPLPKAIHKTNKTGLGSSAALVTSLTAAILQHLNIISLPQPSQTNSLLNPSDSGPSGMDMIHSLAQFSHCLAQGKIGSGFDISSAVYGTHTYRRFSPSILNPLMSSSSPSASSQPLIVHLDPTKWDTQISSFRLPRGLRLMLADVDAGTDTPSFVSKVLAWREREGESAKVVWEGLGKANDVLGELLRDLCGLEGEEGYDQALQEASGQAIEGLDIGKPASQLLVRIRASITLIRSYLQQMSQLSKVPIEPTEQTKLLDACSACPGVLGGGVPGAGGYDAIFLLVIDTPGVIERVEKVWEKWTEMSVCPLKARQSDGGLRSERVEDVEGLKEALERI